MVAELIQTTLVEYALEYAAQGFAVFPVWGINDRGECDCNNSKACNGGDNAGKHPITARGVKDASTNEAKIRVWWSVHPNANIGIATGERSGIVVLDVDGTEGFASLEQFSIPFTPQVATGREDGGIHHWFAWPGHKTKNSASKLAKGLDFRGDGGYVIAPPSRHRSGNVYEWIEPLTETLPEMPEWLIEATAANSPDSGKWDGEGTSPNARANRVIKSGERNATLFRDACKMIGQGFAATAVLAQVRVINETQCEEPLSDSEIERLVESAAKYKPNPALETEGLHNAGNANRLIAMYGEWLRFGKEANKWLAWDQTRFVLEDNAQVFRWATETMEDTEILGKQLGGPVGEELNKWAVKTLRNFGISHMLNAASNHAAVSVSMAEFDTDPFLLNVANGIVDLRADGFGQLLDHDPKYMMTMRASVAFDPKATAPRFERFLDEVFEGDSEIIAYMQQVLGLMLTGDTSDQKFWIAYGTGANGKSTLFNVMRELLGDYGAEAPFNWFGGDTRGPNNEMAKLRKRRFVKVSEAESERTLSEARIKGITGGDKITCRFLYGEYFEYTPEFKLAISLNHRPVIQNNDHGIWRRVKLVSFRRQFSEIEVDRELDSTLRAEFPGILNWLIEGVRVWRENGRLIEPESLNKTTQEYREEMDTLGQWLSACCDIDETPTYDSARSTKASTLFASFRQWFLETQGNQPWGNRRFGEQLGERGFPKKRPSAGFVYYGIALKESDEKITWKGDVSR